MAAPIEFPESNSKWVGPGDTGPLPSLTENGVVLSCWELTQEEIDYVVEYGKVWLTVWGRQPAVNVTAFDPFSVPEEIPDC